MSAQTIDQVVARLQEMEQSLPPSDGVLWFNRLYLDVTLALRRFINTQKLAAPPFLQELTLYFGNRYFDVYDAAAGQGEVPECWAPLFAARHEPRIAPLQFAIAGMNAHIGHDLEIGVVNIWEKLGVVPAPDCPQRQDYDAPGEILGQAEAQTKQWLLTGAIKTRIHPLSGELDWSTFRLTGCGR